MLAHIKQMLAMADTGLLYATNPYDKERYEAMRLLALEMLQNISGMKPEDLVQSFPGVKDYPTAKVDIRGMILSTENKILLVQEATDGKWSLPGGWADIGYSPKENIVKECREETGLDVQAERLLAVFDKRMHQHPPQAFYVYKMIFYCTALPAKWVKGFDVLDVAYFAIDALPSLSEDRILQSQIELIYNKILSKDWQVYAD